VKKDMKKVEAYGNKNFEAKKKNQILPMMVLRSG